MCRRARFRRCAACRKVLPQTLHRSERSPVCTRAWVLRLLNTHYTRVDILLSVCPVVHQKIEIVTKTFVAHHTDIQAITGSTVRYIYENWFEVWAGKRRG